MSSRDTTADFEDLLRRALAPVEPPEDLAQRVEDHLVQLTEAAAEELESWELAAMRDPRNWVRPAAAAAVSVGAGAALVVVRARSRSRRRAQARGFAGAAERALREVAGEAERIVRDARRRA